MATFPAASGLRRLVNQALCSLPTRALPVLSKSIHERFNKLDPATRADMVRVWVILAIFLVLSLAVPPLLLVYFFGDQMADVWVMAATLCFYSFFLLFLCVRRNWRRYTDFFCLSYGLLLIYFAAGMIGPPRTAVFVLHLTTAWAAGHLGYTLALVRLSKGAELAIEFDALPNPSCSTKETAEQFTYSISIGWFVVTVLWTVLMAAIINGQRIGKALDTVFVLSYMGWIHAALWIAWAAGDLMHGLLLLFQKPVPSLPSLLVPCVIASPFIGLLSAVTSVLFQWLLLMALAAFLGYNLAPFTYEIHSVHTTAAPKSKNQERQK